MIPVPLLLHAMVELPSPVGLEDGGGCSRCLSGAVCALERLGESSAHTWSPVQCWVSASQSFWNLEPWKVHYENQVALQLWLCELGVTPPYSAYIILNLCCVWYLNFLLSKAMKSWAACWKLNPDLHCVPEQTLTSVTLKIPANCWRMQNET